MFEDESRIFEVLEGVFPMTVAEADAFQPAFAEMPPGPALALLLGARECDQLDDFDVVEMARSARRLASWAASLELTAIAELAARRRRQGVKLGVWDSEVGEWVTDEVAAALTLSGGTAAHLVVMAEQLAADLPLTFRALADGLIDVNKARVIADGLRGIHPKVAGEVERQVLPAAPGQTCAQLRSAVRRAIEDTDPEGCAERRRLAEEARCLELWDNGQGTSDLSGRNLPAGAASAAWNRVNAIAAALKADGDDRTIDQLRADVFIALLRNERPDSPSGFAPTGPAPTGPSSHTPTGPARFGPSSETPSGPAMPADTGDDRTHAGGASGHEPQVGDRADGDTPGGHHGSGDPLAVARAARADRGGEGPATSPTTRDRRDQHGARGHASPVRDEPAGVEDGRAVAAAVAAAVRARLTEVTDGLARERRRGQAALVREAVRRIKAATAELGSRWCTITTDLDGRAARHGADSYRPPAAMRRWVDARDDTCRFPVCRAPAVRCDADHTEPHHLGGVTCPCNVALLCRRHHRLKQRPEWMLLQVWHGVLVWITPTGHWYVVGPG
jgi:hypothetical protein